MRVNRARPPATLSARIGGSESEYEAIGRAHADWLRRVLPEGWDWAGKKVLDFGCGTGRSISQFEQEAEVADFWGCDIDGDSIAWAADHLSPPFRFVQNEESPPLHFADGTFDLIYGFSVFTHLLDSWSAWLLEMHRLLAVGGCAAFTFLGEGMIGELTGRSWDPDRVGMIMLDAGRPWAIGGPNALHSEWWLRAHWGRAFVVEHVQPCYDPSSRRGHGFVVLRKDSRTPPTQEELEEPVSGDVRELSSARFNVELLLERSSSLWLSTSATQASPPVSVQSVAEAEVALLRRQLDELMLSKSWRMTAPLRRLRHLLLRPRSR